MGKAGRRIRGHKKWWAAALVVVVAVAATGTWMLRRGGDTATAATLTATVQTQTIKTTVAASGTIAAAATADLDFAVSGTVTQVLVKEGAKVTKGQALARVDDASLLASRRAARLTLTAAYTQRDDDLDADASDTQLAADRTAIVTARDGLASAQQAVADATLTATIAGTVTSVGVAKGDVVSSGSSSTSSPSTGSTGSSGSTGAAGSSVSTTADTTSTSAVSIVSTNRFVLDATVSSTDVESVKKGLQVSITATGVTDPIYGTVSSVGAVAETGSSGAAVFPVTIAVTGTRDDVFAGVSADATITVKQVPDVLTVSTRALQTEGDTTYVEKVVDGQDVRTTVKTGEVYGMDTEVTSGLAEGDVVEVPGFTTPVGGGTGTNGGGQMQFPGGGTGGFPGGGTGGGFPGGGTAP